MKNVRRTPAPGGLLGAARGFISAFIMAVLAFAPMAASARPADRNAAIGVAKGLFANTNTVAPTLGNASAAPANTTAIQAALNAGGEVRLTGAGIAYISSTLVIGSNTRLAVSPSLTLRASSAIGNLLVTAAYQRTPTTVTGVTWSSADPLRATVNLGATAIAAVGTVAKDDALWLTGTVGTTDPAFTGVFQVVDATDPANPIIALRRMPAGAATGTIQVRRADQHISVEGGVWDYNNGTNGGSFSTLHAIILAGVRDLRVRSIVGTNTSKFVLCLGAVANFDVEGVEGIAAGSDLVKVYGPAFDGEVRRVSGDGGDDVASMQTMEPSTFIGYAFTGGDVINVALRRINFTRGFGVAVYPTNGWFTMDGLVVDDVNGHAANLSNTPQTLIRVNPPPGTDSFPTGVIKSLTIQNIEQRDDATSAILAINGGSGQVLNIDQLVLDRIRASINPGSVNSALIVTSSFTGTVKYLALKNSRFTVPGVANSYGMSLGGNAIFNEVYVADNLFEGANDNFGYLVQYNSTAALGKITFERNQTKLVGGLLATTSNMPAGPVIALLNNVGSGGGTISVGKNVTVYAAHNNLTGQTLGFLRGNGAITVTAASGGGNVIPAGNFWKVGTAGATITLGGNMADVALDLSATGVNRSPDAIVTNTNSALGTLGVQGLVVGDHAAAGAGSWHLMTDPTKTY